MKAVNKAIEETLKGIAPNAYQCLLSIPGIGPVMAVGILAKYAGLVWRENQSGNFMADNTNLPNVGSASIRYYLIEAVRHVKNHCSEFAASYQKKYDEVKTHQHKRALALTARKFVRLIFGLLAKHQLLTSQLN